MTSISLRFLIDLVKYRLSRRFREMRQLDHLSLEQMTFFEMCFEDTHTKLHELGLGTSEVLVYFTAVH